MPRPAAPGSSSSTGCSPPRPPATAAPSRSWKAARSPSMPLLRPRPSPSFPPATPLPSPPPAPPSPEAAARCSGPTSKTRSIPQVGPRMPVRCCATAPSALTGEERPAATALRRDAALLRNWAAPAARAQARGHAEARWPGSCPKPSPPSSWSPPAASAVSITNRGKQPFHDDLRVFEPFSQPRPRHPRRHRAPRRFPLAAG